MRHIFVCLFILSLTAVASAEEVTTECLMMKEDNNRNNPKAQVVSVKHDPKMDLRKKKAASKQ